jgi:hypothetical protein
MVRKQRRATYRSSTGFIWRLEVDAAAEGGGIGLATSAESSGV